MSGDDSRCETSGLITAYWADLPYMRLKKVSGRIINEVRGNLMLHVRVGQPGSPHTDSCRYPFRQLACRLYRLAHR